MSALSLSELARKTEHVQSVATPLPGLSPYTNVRSLSVEGRFEGLLLRDFLRLRHPHIALEFWAEAASAGRLYVDGKPVQRLDGAARGGNLLTYQIPNTTEPVVDASIEFLYEDEHLVGLHKPAPLPFHPCGRFNRHSLTALLKLAFADTTLRPVHRLDADTTGVIVLAKTRGDAAALAIQFRSRTVRKRYLALVRGEVPWRTIESGASVQRAAGVAGRRQVDPAGLDAHTSFERLHVAEGCSLLAVTPHTGRTHQIRIHLASLGHPIVGDHAYGDAPQRTLSSDGISLHLHAWQLEFAHPATRETMRLEATPPAWAEREGS